MGGCVRPGSGHPGQDSLFQEAKPELRTYQAAGIVRLREAVLAGHHRTILVSPAGSGKTTVAASIMESAIVLESRILFLAHRKELIEQASLRLSRFNLSHGIIKAGFRPDPQRPIQVASVQTLMNRDLSPADLIIVDECHHAKASSYLNILDAYPDAVVIGLTATPIRSDGKGLGDVFDAMVEIATPSELIKMGFLVPSRVLAPSSPDLVGIRTVGGDYDQRQLKLRVERPNLLGSIADHWGRHARGQRAVAFAVDVGHSHDVVNVLRGVGARALHIDAKTPDDERSAALRMLKEGELDVVSNVGILTEGWDLPQLGAVLMLRPTLSLALYIQMTMRGSRPADGKTSNLILDHAGNALRHGFPEDDRAWSLAASKPRKPGEAPLKHCKMCFLVMVASAAACPECGYEFPIERSGIVQKPGELTELSAADLKARKKLAQQIEDWLYFRTLAHFKRRADGSPYNPHWALYKFKERHRQWPSRDVRAAWSEDIAADLAARFYIDTSDRDSLRA